jgi:hypothetical protein
MPLLTRENCISVSLLRLFSVIATCHHGEIIPEPPLPARPRLVAVLGVGIELARAIVVPFVPSQKLIFFATEICLR